MQRLRICELTPLLGHSENRLRSIAVRFASYLPMIRIGSEQYFELEAVEIFRLILQQFEVGVSDEYVEVMLAKRYPVAIVTFISADYVATPDASLSLDGVGTTTQDGGDVAHSSISMSLASPGDRQPSGDRNAAQSPPRRSFDSLNGRRTS